MASDSMTPAQRALHNALMDLLEERTDTDGEALGQLILAGVRIMAQHMEPNRACEAFLECVRQTVANLRH